MVAQRNKTIRMRSRVTRGKENILSSVELRHKEETFWRKLALSIQIFRHKIQSRVDRCQEVLQRLDHDAKQMKVCFLQLMDMIENSRKLISDEKEENLQLLQFLDDFYADKTSVSSKTQTVAPMVYGIPLKKASISLRRLDPFREQHNQNISAVIADSSPASAVGFSRSETSTPLHRNISVTSSSSSSSSQSSSSSSSEDEDTSSNIQLPRSRTSRRWNKLKSPVSSTSGQEFHLKRASIQLKRLDPRSYPHEAADGMEPIKSNITFQRSVIESEVFESLYRAALEANAEAESSRTETERVANEENYTSLPSQPDPMVVLERLGPFPHSGELNFNDQSVNSGSASTDLNIVLENCQSGNKLKKTCETNGKSKAKPENAKKSRQQAADSMGTPKNRKSEDSAYVTPERQRNRRINAGKRPIKEGAESSSEVKRKKPDTVRKKKESIVASNSTNKGDEDPLEGPSWLYKDGVKKERLRKFKKIRQEYLTPIYYLAPTIYSSSDVSGDEMTEVEKKKSKLRKKKQRKRN